MIVEEGPGWRISLDTSRSPHCLLLGGQGWAAEFTLAEARALASGARALEEQRLDCLPSLMPEEQLTLELERDGIWLELDGKGQDWAFRFVLSPPERERRGVEGSWKGSATRAVMQSLRLLESGALGSADPSQHLVFNSGCAGAANSENS